MRNTIREYIELSVQEKVDLWDYATFVFDTNIFLNLYRLSNKSRKQLLSAFEKMKDRIWMPYQVAVEFCEERYDVISETNMRFKNMENDVNDIVEKWRNLLRTSKDDKEIKALEEYLKTWLHNKKDCNYNEYDIKDDVIFKQLLEMFDGKVGKPFEQKEVDEIDKEGADRYKKQIPPGYKDGNKKKNKYGDLYIWKEILKYANNKKVNVIFVTGDEKEDWWNIKNGKKIGPRVELRKEFFNETGMKIHIYTLSAFLDVYGKSNNEAIDEKVIQEIELLDSEDKKEKYDNKTKEISIKEIDKNSLIAKVNYEIAKLEAKNKKRMHSISVLSHKQKRQQLSIDEEIALTNNKKYLLEDTMMLKKLQFELEDLISIDET